MGLAHEQPSTTRVFWYEWFTCGCSHGPHEDGRDAQHQAEGGGGKAGDLGLGVGGGR